MKEIAIYGAGRMGRVLFEILNPIIDVNYFVDGDSTKWGLRIGKVEIISPEELIKKQCITILSIESEMVKQYLFKNGIHYYYAWKEESNFLCIPEIKQRRDEYLLDRYLHYSYEKQALFYEPIYGANCDNPDHVNVNMSFYEKEELWYDEYVDNRADLRLLCKLLHLFHNGETVCDVGCGNGKLLEELSRNNFSVIGIDGSERRILSLKNLGYEVYLRNFEEPFEMKDEVDVVTCMHVLEHIINIDEMIRSINKMLKKDGTVYIGVPNGKLIDDITHVRQFTSNSLCNLLMRFGFEIENVQQVPYLNYNYNNSILLRARKMKEI